MTKIIEVIITQDRRGLGQTEKDPVRNITQLWTKDWKLIGEVGFEKDWDKTFIDKVILDNL